MKKRRTLVISLLLLAALAIGIVYADATQSKLSISGNASTIPTAINVVFTEESKIKSVDSAKDDAALETSMQQNSTLENKGSTDIVFKAVGMRDVGDKVVGAFQIKNNSNYEVTLGTPTLAKAPAGKFAVDFSTGFYDYSAGTTFANVLQPGETVWVDVTVELVTNDSASTISETFVIETTVTGTR